MSEIREGGDPQGEVTEAEWQALIERTKYLSAHAKMERARANSLKLLHPERIVGLVNNVLGAVTGRASGMDPGLKTRRFYNFASQCLDTVDRYLNRITDDGEFRKLETSVDEHTAPAGREAIWAEANRLGQEDFKDKFDEFSKLAYYMEQVTI